LLESPFRQILDAGYWSDCSSDQIERTQISQPLEYDSSDDDMTEPSAMASAAVLQVGAANMRAFLNYMEDLTSGGRKTKYETSIRGADGENTINRDEHAIIAEAKLRIADPDVRAVIEGWQQSKKLPDGTSWNDCTWQIFRNCMEEMFPSTQEEEADTRLKTFSQSSENQRTDSEPYMDPFEEGEGG